MWQMVLVILLTADCLQAWPDDSQLYHLPHIHILPPDDRLLIHPKHVEV
jgi:hypothetical protein